VTPPPYPTQGTYVYVMVVVDREKARAYAPPNRMVYLNNLLFIQKLYSEDIRSHWGGVRSADSTDAAVKAVIAATGIDVNYYRIRLDPRIPPSESGLDVREHLPPVK